MQKDNRTEQGSRTLIIMKRVGELGVGGGGTRAEGLKTADDHSGVAPTQ